MDLKLFSQRFFEYVNQQQNPPEIHEYVSMLMKQDTLGTFENKVKLIKNLCNGLVGLEGDYDELVLISILNIIIMRLLPESEDNLESTTLVDTLRLEKENERLGHSLIEWQNVMYESGVPNMVLEYISMEQDPYLANQAIILLNNMLFNAPEENQ
jgi:hypothetical protein